MIQLVEGKLIEEEAIFIDGTKIEAYANKFTFVWRKSIDRFSQKLIEKSLKMYEELLEKRVIPEIKRESADELTFEELEEIVQSLDEKVETFDQQIEASEP